MMGTTQERSRTARESKVQALAFFLVLSTVIHGTFFPQEWFFLGAVMSIFNALALWKTSWGLTWRSGYRERAWGLQLSLTDGLLVALLLLSLLGLVKPIKASEGLLDAVRWYTLWLAYRMATSLKEEQSQSVLRWIEGLGIFIALIGWIPFLYRMWPELIPGMDGRIASLFGYPNALGAYCAAILLLKPQSKWVRALIFTSLLNTGSRAAITIFLVIWLGRELLLWKTQKVWNSNKDKGQFKPKLLREGILLAILLSVGIMFTLRWNQQTVEHLLDWGISTSLGERLLYVRDGLNLAFLNKGFPSAGGWFAFPLVQDIPYWAADPHTLVIRILLHQGLLGLILCVVWGIWVLVGVFAKLRRVILDKNSVNMDFVRTGSALLFLTGHALVDTDFLFGALGMLYWTLFGMFFSPQLASIRLEGSNGIDSYYTRIQSLKLIREFRRITNLFLVGLGLTLLLPAGNPQWFEPGDQFLHEERQAFARLAIEQKGSNGLEVMDNVLAWEKFDLRTYEWAQSVVIEEAEKRKEKDVEQANKLYRWAASVPERIVSLQEVSAFEKIIWPEAENFKPSELNLLFAEFAKERQLTLR